MQSPGPFWKLTDAVAGPSGSAGPTAVGVSPRRPDWAALLVTGQQWRWLQPLPSQGRDILEAVPEGLLIPAHPPSDSTLCLASQNTN